MVFIVGIDDGEKLPNWERDWERVSEFGSYSVLYRKNEKRRIVDERTGKIVSEYKTD